MEPTHEVTNQPDMTPDGDLYASDPILRHWLAETGGAEAPVAAYGARLGGLREAGREANRYPPELRLFDRGGRRLDEVAFHPAYHAQMAAGVAAGYAALPWEGEKGGHAAHAAMVYMLSQVDPGVCCPLTMTYAGIPALRDAGGPPVWLERLASRTYDPAVRPVGEKAGATLGMAMTEKQGGSDVRTNATRAEKDGTDWRLTGHKWFCSAPMSDGFLTLAQAPGGLTCFLVPRWLPDGGRNAVHLMRLKDKLGNRSNASAEIEYHRAHAVLIGEEGEGVRTILRMVHHTRLDTAMAPAGLMRAALAEALRWCEGRVAFQRRLVDQPLMRCVLADLALDLEGSLALGLHVARAFDGDTALARIGVALAKYLSNKLAPGVVCEAMEVLGGMGYVEDTPLPMLYREAPLNAIWEGSGNVICLDVLRTLAREPASRAALEEELDAGRGLAAFDAALAAFRARWPREVPESEARWFTETAATLLTASVLLRFAPGPVGAAYAATRLAGARGRTAGALAVADAESMLRRIRA
jgi:putative acyl-CoA dehydrogenase